MSLLFLISFLFGNIDINQISKIKKYIHQVNKLLSWDSG